MAALILSPTSSRRRVGWALAASVLVHCAAVAFASLHADRASVYATDWGDFPPVEVENNDDPPAVPPQAPDVPESNPLPLPDVTSSFPTEAATPAPPPTRKVIPSQPLRAVNTTSAKGGESSPTARALAVHAPRPDYPYEARRARITGAGLAILTVDSAHGDVTGVAMAESTGSSILDQAAIAGFRRWHFRPGTPPKVRCPITYTLTGAAF